MSKTQNTGGANNDSITAPYNFVPLSPVVVTPEWADQVSHDKPFRDGWSGRLTIELETKTPLFVGAGSERPRGENGHNRKKPFLREGKRAIPGSSLKGAIRNVVEIATFGRLGDCMDEHRMSMRDLQNPRDYTHRLTANYGPKSKAGWLELRGDKWFLIPCDYSVVKQEDLEEYYNKLDRENPVNLGIATRSKGAIEKYEKWCASYEIAFDPQPWSPEGGWAKGRYLSRASEVGKGRTKGILVFTGQPQNRMKKGERDKNAKRVEFLFHSERPNDAFGVPKPVRDNFEAGHRDPNNGKPNTEWAYWWQKLLNGERAPVFWLEPEEKSAREKDEPEPISDMGLAMMFRLPYRYKPQAQAADYQDGDNPAPDFAETLFGYVGKQDALKGRVAFSDATTSSTSSTPAEEAHRVIAPLLAPKPSFYPAYVRQRRRDANQPDKIPKVSVESDGETKEVADYTTFMHEDARPRGWKRYPVAHNVRSHTKAPQGDPAKADKKDVLTEFTPVAAGTKFRAEIDVHNLRPVELGALVWALTFGKRHDTPSESSWHALGAGRSLGYGATAIRITDATLEPNDINTKNSLNGTDALDYLWEKAVPAFREEMQRHVTDWGPENAQIRELLAMASPLPEDDAKKLKEMGDPRPF